MNLPSTAYRFYDLHPQIADFRAEILQGLAAQPAYILSKYFYDEAGSRLFAQICNTADYYPTRTETAILHDNIDDIADTLGRECLLVEPGSGDSAKVRRMLDVLKPIAYLPMDISSSYLQHEAKKLAEEFPWLDVHAVCNDFTESIEIPFPAEHLRKVAFFPGSTIGNFKPDEAVLILKRIARVVGKDGGLLIGVDLQKDSATLSAAYNDSQGITAQFNLNLLTRINRELGADFDVSSFSHYAFYNEPEYRIEIYLKSEKNQQVTIDDQVFQFSKDALIHTEYSHKYSIEGFQALAAKAGLHAVRHWTDKDDLFSVQYFECG